MHTYTLTHSYTHARTPVQSHSCAWFMVNANLHTSAAVGTGIITERSRVCVWFVHGRVYYFFRRTPRLPPHTVSIRYRSRPDLAGSRPVCARRVCVRWWWSGPRGGRRLFPPAGGTAESRTSFSPRAVIDGDRVFRTPRHPPHHQLNDK